MADAREWIRARDSLANTLQGYLDACLWFKDSSAHASFPRDQSAAILQTFDQELKNISAYMSKLRHAHAALGVARNYSKQLVPINRLPHEVLSRIFGIVGEYRAPHSYDLSKPKKSFRYPELLSEVCTFWNQLVKNTPALWSRIKLVVCGSEKDTSYARASRFLRFSNNSPISIRIKSSSALKPNEVSALLEWLTPAMKRVYRLETGRNWFSASDLHSILACWLDHSDPGSVKVLDLYFHQPRFDTPSFELDSSSETNGGFSMSSQRFQKFFKPLTLLRLNGISLRWDHYVFGGLAHLSLRTGSITEMQLIALLSHNPELRSLSLSLKITEAVPHELSSTPVHLSNLRTLNINSRNSSDILLVLRMIAPGPGPLKMSMRALKDDDSDNNSDSDNDGDNDNPNVYPVVDECLQNFFRRANVVALSISERASIAEEHPEATWAPWFPHVLGLLPHLQMLSLESVCLTSKYELLLSSSKVCQNLRSLCLNDCRLHLETLKQMLRRYSIRNLVMWDCDVMDNLGPKYWTPRCVEEELCDFASKVRCYDDYPMDGDPFADWDYEYF
ncbi:pre-mRNA-processing-splicing factor 8 [Ceratobasidium sp. AG-Ba]|nr:pre-mRNA-processing-splicing factor 8 [Ceratobasidium sp. AG-Ba]QRV98812.1 pre-mRNA-processing-splicing factor 8 [Ceratobasidium sp. AG-Ba]